MVAAAETVLQRFGNAGFDARRYRRCAGQPSARSRAADCHAIRACSPKLSARRLEAATLWFVRIHYASCDAKRDTWSFGELREALLRRWSGISLSPRMLSYHIASAVKAGAIERFHGQLHLPRIRAQQEAFGMPQRWVSWMPPPQALLQRREKARLKKRRQRAAAANVAAGGGDSCNGLQDAPAKMPLTGSSEAFCSVSPPLLEPPQQRRALAAKAAPASEVLIGCKPGKFFALAAPPAVREADRPATQASATAVCEQASASAATAHDGKAVGHRDQEQELCHDQEAACDDTGQQQLLRDDKTVFARLAPVEEKKTGPKPLLEKPQDADPYSEEAIAKRVAASRASREARLQEAVQRPGPELSRSSAVGDSHRREQPRPTGPGLATQAPVSSVKALVPQSAVFLTAIQENLENLVLPGDLPATMTAQTPSVLPSLSSREALAIEGYNRQFWALEADQRMSMVCALTSRWRLSENTLSVPQLDALRLILPHLRRAPLHAAMAKQRITLRHLSQSLLAVVSEAPGRAHSREAAFIGIALSRKRAEKEPTR